ncbi:MAG TPA: EAL domain-containing protein [Jatrophihabitans sp.]|nr:EAL domain-containing protein [Jatrophihabitans sp.]
MSLTDVVVGRQPIVDRNRNVIGYELLFRPSDSADSSDIGGRLDGSQMTTEVLFSALGIGVHRLVGDKLMFCNAERSVLTGEVPMVLPPEDTVIEVLEDVEMDAEVLDGCRRLVAAGYRLALDDFVWSDAADALLRLAWVVKLDVRAMSREELAESYRRCREYGVRMLAEKVETADDVEFCRELGFDLFQGHAFSRAETVAGRTIDASQLSRIRLATQLLGPDLDFEQFERVASADPGLVLQLLQLAALGRPGENRRPVRTIREALVRVGTRRLQNWLSFLMLRNSVPASPDELTTALVRAQMCELLAARRQSAEQGQGYIAGLVSSFTTLLGAAGPQIVESLDLDDGVRAAALHHTSDLGLIVSDVIAYQDGQVEPALSGVARGELDAAAARAFAWATITIDGANAA